MAQRKQTSVSREELRAFYAAEADAVTLANMTEPLKLMPAGVLRTLATRIERELPHGPQLAEYLRRTASHVENRAQRESRDGDGGS